MKKEKRNKLYFISILMITVVLFSMNIKKQQPAPWVAPASAGVVKNPCANKPDMTEKGKLLFNTQCSPCHGTSGKGDGVAAISITPRPQNLTSDLVQNQADGAIFWKITTGKPPMASYKTTLTDIQRWQLVNYLRQLKAQAKK